MITWSETPQEKLNVAGQALEYACWGPPPAEAPTLILLHEGLGCVSLWKSFPAELARATGWGVFAYSRAGYGRSSPVTLPRPLDYMAREAEDVLPAVIDAVGAQDIVLLGHSDGATIAATYAGSVSDMRIRGIALLAPHFFTEAEGLAAIAQSKQDYEQGDLKERLSKHHDHPDQAFFGWHDVWVSDGFRDWNAGDEIDHWRIPCLSIQGHDDAYGTMAQIDEIETRIYSPHDRVDLANCGHAPHQEQPEATLNALTEFTARLKRLEDEPVLIEQAG